MKRLATTLSLSTFLLALSACGGGKSTATKPETLTLNSGNFLLLEDSTNNGNRQNYPLNVQLAGALTAGSSMSLTALPTGLSSSPCFPPQTPLPSAVVFTGATSGNSVTMMYAGANQQMAIAATINPGDNITGTYVESGTPAGNGGACIADTGTVYGTVVPSLTGTWTGTLPGREANVNQSPIATTAFSASLTQSTTASTTANALNLYPGTFPLSGSVTLTNASCFSAGNVTLPIDATASYVQGQTVVLSAVSADKTISFTFPAPSNVLQDPTTATSIVIGGFSINGDLCAVQTSPTVNTVILQKS